MSLGGRLRYKRKVGIKSIRRFRIEGKNLSPADWAEVLQKLKALLNRYGIKITGIK